MASGREFVSRARRVDAAISKADRLRGQRAGCRKWTDAAVGFGSGRRFGQGHDFAS